MLQYGLSLKTVRLSRKPRLRERTDKDTGNQWWGVSRTRSLKSLSSACYSRLSQSCIQKPVCHSSKPQGRRDLWRGHLPRPVPPCCASTSPCLLPMPASSSPPLGSSQSFSLLSFPEPLAKAVPTYFLLRVPGRGAVGSTGRLLQKSSPCDISGKGLRKGEE